jgi:excisionase family DNA binding protein
MESVMSLTNLNEHEPLAFNIPDFCRLIGVGRSTVYHMMNRGEIEVVQIGRRKLVTRETALALLESNKVKKPEAA